jgi:regulatory protein
LVPDDSNGPPPSELRAYAYRLLGRREYSAAELEQRLSRKWPGLETRVLEGLVATLVEENRVSDERFTESFVRSQRQRCQGPLKIRAALRAKGVADALISAELDRGDAAWTDLASRWLERRHPGPLDFETRKKYYRRLVNRGFTHHQAMDALNRRQDGNSGAVSDPPTPVG